MELGDYDSAADLLASRQSAAGDLADDYLFWSGEARFQAGSYAAAADDFQQLLVGFPESEFALDAQVGQAMALADVVATALGGAGRLAVPGGSTPRAFLQAFAPSLADTRVGRAPSSKDCAVSRTNTFRSTFAL